MGSARRGIFATLFAKVPLHLDGKVDQRFLTVERTFRRNFVDGWERDGAAFTVFYEGRKVVDMWGGYADSSVRRKWTENTIMVTFSSTKAVAALCIALLVDRGHVSYNDLIVNFWPEFGRHGKDNVTVQWALSHMAGLAAIDEPITKENCFDHKSMAKILENQKPNWPPGTATGYHGFTYGWIVDQIVRKTDPLNRSIGQFFREEIALPHGVDFHIGLPKEDQHRVARLTEPGIFDSLAEVITDYRILKFLYNKLAIRKDSLVGRMLNNPDWLKVLFANNPDFHRLEQAAVLGIGNARSLAEIFQLALNGTLIKKETLRRISKPHIMDKMDLIIGEKIPKGYGMFYKRWSSMNGQNYLMGHPGFGGQNVQYDPEHKLVLAYVGNGLKTGLGDLCRTYIRLREAVYKAIDQDKLK